MPHFLIAIQMTCRQTFLVEAESSEQAAVNYGDGKASDWEHDEPQLLAMKQVNLDENGNVTDQADLFA